MMLVGLAVAGFALVGVSAEPRVTRQTVDRGLNPPPQSWSMTREGFREGAKQPFGHTRELMDSLSQGTREFEVKEWFDHNDAKVWKMDSFEDTLNKGYYSLITKYSLHDDAKYFNYDDAAHHSPASGSYLKSVSSRHLEHCADNRQGNSLATLERHSALVGSTHGAWNSKNSYSKVKQELVFSHRVLKVEHSVDPNSGHHCTFATLEALHAWELFSNVNLQALVEHPFDTVTMGQDLTSEEDQGEKERNLQLAVPDPPLKQCSNPEYADIGDGITDLSIVSGNAIRMNKDKGCAIFQKDLPGTFAANFNPGTQRAASPFQWGVITCDNCFAVLGAGAMAVINYRVVWHFVDQNVVTFMAQVKFAGNAGAAVSLKGAAGTVSGTREFPMTNFAGANAKIPLGSTGLTLTLSFGGASLKLSGSADFEGEFSVAYGQLGGLAVSGMYVGGFKFFNRASWRNLNQPWTNNGFRVARWSVNAEVIATENIQLSFGSVLYANFNVFLGASVTLTGGSPVAAPQMSNLQLTSSAASSIRHREMVASEEKSDSEDESSSSSSSASSQPLSLRPGDEIRVSFDYDDFHDGDEMEFYYTLLSLSTGNEYPILNKNIVVEDGGAGTVQATWSVPWNLDLSRLGQVLESSFGGQVPDSLKDPEALTQVQGQNGEFQGAGNKAESPTAVDSAATGTVTGNFVLRVRSNYFGDHEIVASEPLSFDMFSGSPKDGIFSSPDAMDNLSVDVPITINWHASQLRRFEQGMHSWTGQDVATTKVNIDLVAEHLDDQGTNVEFSTSVPLAKGIDNSGSTSVMFASTDPAIRAGHRFYLVVSDVSKPQVQGWSRGYFFIAQPKQQQHLENEHAATAIPAAHHHKQQWHPTVASRRQLTSAATVDLLTLDTRLLHAYDTRALFGGYGSDRPTIYEGFSSRSDGAATTGNESVTEKTDELTSLSRALQSATSTSCSPTGAVGSASSAQLFVPWTLTIFGGAGIQSVGVSLKVISYDKPINLESRGTLLTMNGKLTLPAKLSAAIKTINSGNFGNKGNCPPCPASQYRNDQLQCVACPKGQVLVSNQRALQMHSQRLLQAKAKGSIRHSIVDNLRLGRAGDMQATCFPKKDAEACPEGQVFAPPQTSNGGFGSTKNISNGWRCVPCPNGVCPGGNGVNGAATSTSTPWPQGCPRPELPDCSKFNIVTARISCESQNRLKLVEARARCSVGLAGVNDCSKLSGSAKAACVAKNMGSAACVEPAGGMVAAACDCASRDTASEKAQCAANSIAGIICDKQTDSRKAEICNKAKSCIGKSGRELGACMASTVGIAACSYLVKDPTALSACKAAADCVQGKSAADTAKCAGQGAATAVCNGKLQGTAQTGCVAASQCIGLVGDAARQCAKQAIAATGVAACQNNVQNSNLQTGCINAANCATQKLTREAQAKCLSDAACTTTGGAGRTLGCQQALACRKVLAGPQRTKCLEDAAATACQDVSNENLRAGCQASTQCAGAANKKGCLGNAAVAGACARLSGSAQQGCAEGLKCAVVANKVKCLENAAQTACQALTGENQALCQRGAQCATAANPASCLGKTVGTAVCSRLPAGPAQQGCNAALRCLTTATNDRRQCLESAGQTACRALSGSHQANCMRGAKCVADSNPALCFRNAGGGGTVAALSPAPAAAGCAELQNWIGFKLADSEGESSFVRGLKAMTRGIAKNSVAKVCAWQPKPVPPAGATKTDCSRLRGPARTKCLSSTAAAQAKQPVPSTKSTKTAPTSVANRPKQNPAPRGQAPAPAPKPSTKQTPANRPTKKAPAPAPRPRQSPRSSANRPQSACSGGGMVRDVRNACVCPSGQGLTSGRCQNCPRGTRASNNRCVKVPLRRSLRATEATENTQEEEDVDRAEADASDLPEVVAVISGFDALLTAVTATSGLETSMQGEGASQSFEAARGTSQLALGYQVVSEVHAVLQATGVEGA